MRAHAFGFAALIAISACSNGSSGDAVSTTAPSARTQIEVRIAKTDALPPLLIEAYFDAAIEARPHVQPLSAALVAARQTCGARTANDVMTVTVRDRHIALAPGDRGCLATAIAATPIDDSGSYTVELAVRVSS